MLAMLAALLVSILATLAPLIAMLAMLGLLISTLAGLPVSMIVVLADTAAAALDDMPAVLTAPLVAAAMA
ncbi:hypothetical protein EV176_006065, partial [Coemansia sp. RSA 451]